MTIQLETDSTAAGPKGRLTATLRDGDGNTLATAVSRKIGTGGKGAGKAAIRNFSSQVAIDPAVASKVRSIHLEAQCAGSVTRLYNVRLGTTVDAFKVAVTVAAAL